MKEPCVTHVACSSNTCQVGFLGSDILGGSPEKKEGWRRKSPNKHWSCRDSCCESWLCHLLPGATEWSFWSSLRGKVFHGKGRDFVQGLNVMIYSGNTCLTTWVIYIRHYFRHHVPVVNKTMYESLQRAHIWKGRACDKRGRHTPRGSIRMGALCCLIPTCRQKH